MTNDEDVICRLMYGESSDKKAPKPKGSKVNISQAGRAIVMEVDGVRHQIPSVASFNALLQESQHLKNENIQLRTDIKKLTEAIKKLENGLINVERELATKADIYGDN